MKTYSLLVLAIFSLQGFSQSAPGNFYGSTGGVSRNADIFNPNGSLSLRVNNTSLANPNSSEIQGTKYLFDKWDGNYIIQSIQGIRYNLNSLNYNLESKKLESLLTKDSIFELRSSQVDLILANNKKYKVINEELYQELNTGKFKIYKQFNVKVQDAFVNPMTKTESSPAQYIQVGKYFYFKNDVLVPLKLNKKEVLTMLKDKETEIKKFASEKDFSFSDEADVVKIVNYYNTL